MTATSSHQITSIHVKVFVAPSDITIFLAALERTQAVVGALPESVSFDLFQNLDMPGEFKYIENWNASLDWIMATAAKNEACQEYFRVTEKMFIKPKEMEIWYRMTKDK